MKTDNIKIPKSITQTKKRKIEKQLQLCKNEADRQILKLLLDPRKQIENERKIIFEFLEGLENKSLIDFYIAFLGSFRNEELYNRFIASIRLYSRIHNLQSDIDKFLYWCISVEAALNFGGINIDKGKTKLFKSFFKENLPKDTKIKLISSFKNAEYNTYLERHSIRIYRNKIKKENFRTNKRILLPKCYDEGFCWIEYGKCHPDIYCYISDDDNKLNEYLDSVFDYLYQKRSNFIHEGKLWAPQFEKGDMIPAGNLDMWRIGKKQKQNVVVVFNITFEDLRCAYEEALLNYFTKFNRK
jgi:hypothetical protein